jgi:hypothetical protein
VSLRLKAAVWSVHTRDCRKAMGDRSKSYL